MRKVFKVNHQTAKFVARKKSITLSAKTRPCIRIIEKCADVNPIRSIEILHHRENFHSRVFRFHERHDLVIHRTNRDTLHYIEQLVGLLIDGLQPAIRRKHLQPCWKKQVDLARVFTQRGEAGCVPGNVKRSADAFLGIQLHLRRG